jgi:hypothetical protein
VLDVLQIARAYDLPLIDYDRHPNAGLLISVGSGLMMASMDAATKCAWCIDIPASLIPKLNQAMDAFKMVCDPIIFVAWFSVTDPKAALELKESHPEIHCYFRGLGSDTEETWEEIMERGR